MAKRGIDHRNGSCNLYDDRCRPLGRDTRSVLKSMLKDDHPLSASIRVKRPLYARYAMESRTCGVFAATALLKGSCASNMANEPLGFALFGPNSEVLLYYPLVRDVDERLPRPRGWDEVELWPRLTKGASSKPKQRETLQAQLCHKRAGMTRPRLHPAQQPLYSVLTTASRTDFQQPSNSVP
jgi:hypothetical protein